jgi:phosphoglycolate phosphatase
VNSDLPPPAAILYDWDNTLVDTWPVLHAAMNALFRHMEMPEWSLAETRARVRHSLRDAFPAMFGDRWEEARDVFYAAFEERHLEELSPAPQAEVLLRAVAAAGVPQSVVSNKQGGFLRKEAAALGWAPLFHALVGAGDAPRDKPAPEPVALALKESGVAPGPTVYFVGDSGVDMRIAHAAGLTPVLIHAAPDLHKGEFADDPPAAVFPDLATFHDFFKTKRPVIC